MPIQLLVAKIFGMVLILVALWIGITIYTEGSERAFGGIFAGLSGSEPQDLRSPLERIEESARSARDAQLDRIERQLEEAPPGFEE